MQRFPQAECIANYVEEKRIVRLPKEKSSLSTIIKFKKNNNQKKNKQDRCNMPTIQKFKNTHSAPPSNVSNCLRITLTSMIELPVHPPFILIPMSSNIP